MKKRGRPAKKTKEDNSKVEGANARLKQTLSALEKVYGKGIIAPATDILDIETIKTKILLIEILLKGGFPLSSIITFYGQESTGKSLFASIFASVITDLKKKVLIVDCEHSVSKSWLKKLGVDLKYTYISQPDEFEKAIDIIDTCVRSKEFGLIILDSLTSAVPKEEVESSAYKQQMALQARLNSKLMKKITSGLQSKDLTDESTYNKTIIILIAQLREKVGVCFGNPRIIPGGYAVKQHSHYILGFTKGDVLTRDDEPIGRQVKIKVEKAKYSPPLVKGVTEFYFNPPKINNAKVLLTYALQYGIIKQSKSWLEYKEFKIQGKNKLLKAIKEKKPEYLEEIKEALIKYEK